MKMGKIKYKQYFGAFIVSLGGLALGTSIAWNSSFFSYQHYHTDATSFEIGFVGFIFNIGACFGALCAPCLLERFSYTKTISLMTPLFFFGCLFISFSQAKIIYMLIGRSICGIFGGILCVLVPIYVAEIADKEIRSRLMTFFHFLINCGIMYAFVISYMTEEQKNYWQYGFLCAICCSPIALIGILPESSFYYLSKNDELRAKKSLIWYNGKSQGFNDELEELKNLCVVHESKMFRSKDLKFPLKNKKVWQSFSTCLLVTFIHQLSFINIIIFCSFPLMEIYKLSEDFYDILIIGGIQIIASAVATIFIDLIGRRILLTFSSLFMAMFLGMLGWVMSISIEDSDFLESYSWAPMTLICLYFAAFNIGVGPLAWSLPADSFPVEIKVIGASAVVFLSWSMSMIAVLILYKLFVLYGAIMSVWVFASFSLIGSVILFFSVRETKGKSLVDIQMEFKNS